MSIQYGDYTDIEMNPSQLSRALDIPIFELEYFILGVRDGCLDYQPNVVGFFNWLTNMLDGKNPKEFMDWVDYERIPWTLFSRLLSATNLNQFLSDDQIGVIADALGLKASSF